MTSVSEKEPTMFYTRNLLRTELIKLNILAMLCEFTAPVNFISKVLVPMLKAKEPDGLLWNFFSMSELFTGLRLPFESCPEQLKNISSQLTKKTNY